MTLVEEAYPDSRVMQKEEARLKKTLKVQRAWIGALAVVLVVLGGVLVNLGLMIDNPYASAGGGAVVLIGAVYGIFWIMDDEAHE